VLVVLGAVVLELGLFVVGSVEVQGSAGQQKMIIFLIGLEIGLRLVTDGSHGVLARVRERRGSDSDLGIWRTLWRTIRRPVSAIPTVAADAPTVVSVAPTAAANESSELVGPLEN
jgi:hypothetical protein